MAERSTSPAFQPDSGDGGFQLAAHGGYQTQTPVWAGALGLVAGLDSPTAYTAQSPSHAVVGDLGVVVGFTALTVGPRQPSGAGILWRGGRRYYVAGDLAVAVGWVSHCWDRERDDMEAIQLLLGVGEWVPVPVGASARGLSRREIAFVEADDQRRLARRPLRRLTPEEQEADDEECVFSSWAVATDRRPDAAGVILLGGAAPSGPGGSARRGRGALRRREIG